MTPGTAAWLLLPVFLAALYGLGHYKTPSGIELRADIHPLAVLSLALLTVPRGETEPSGTTAGYSWVLRR